MDEREEAGMRALTEGVRRAEEAGASGAGMLSLAISYTNEAFERASHTMLMRWLRARHPDFVPAASAGTTAWATHDTLTNAFLAVARKQHADGIVDPELQMALGVSVLYKDRF